MILELKAHGAPKRPTDLTLEVRIVDIEDFDAPARDLTKAIIIPIESEIGETAVCVHVENPSQLDSSRPASLLVRLTGVSDEGKPIKFMNTTNVAIPKNGENPIPIDLFPIR